MRNLLTAAVLVAAPVIGAACSGDDAVPAVSADDAQLAQGRTLWAANCTACHGATGGGGVGPKLNGGRVLERYPDAAAEVALVTGGRGQMPAFGQKLSPDQVTAVVRYTREVIARQ